MVQGCVAVVYLSCTMLWHGLGSDTSHNQTLPLWVKTAPLHGLVNLSNCYSGGDKNCGAKLLYCMMAEYVYIYKIYASYLE